LRSALGAISGALSEDGWDSPVATAPWWVREATQTIERAIAIGAEVSSDLLRWLEHLSGEEGEA